MEKIRLGKTEMMVSKLGFGGIPIQRVSEDAAVAIVKRCLDLGITFLDTANAYTTSEERIGKAIKGQKREDIILATKSASRSREGVANHLKLSLERLGVDYIDLYQFHEVDDYRNLEIILDPNGLIVVVEEAKKAGVVNHIGVTSHQIDVAKDLVKSDRFETIMFPFNLINSETADDLLPLCREHDVGFIAMKPLAGGILDNITLAFKYLVQFPNIIPIPGIEKIQEIEEIVQVLNGPLEINEAERYEIQRLRDELGTKFCRRCDYCQPCTEEIPISTVMLSITALKRLPPELLFTGGKFPVAIEKATNCNKCGDCEERCPYNLPIREMLVEQVNLFQEAKKKYEEQITT
jgi:predicted aldo/keto reductase-like oxidoreductase